MAARHLSQIHKLPTVTNFYGFDVHWQFLRQGLWVPFVERWWLKNRMLRNQSLHSLFERDGQGGAKFLPGGVVDVAVEATSSVNGSLKA